MSATAPAGSVAPAANVLNGELRKAAAIADLLFTVACENQIDGLCKGTLEHSLDALIRHIGEAREALGRLGVVP